MSLTVFSVKLFRLFVFINFFNYSIHYCYAYTLMARWGEGDPRWIVENRPDSVNVNNWHWREKSADKWSSDFFTKSFTKLPFASDNGSFKGVITEISSIKGDSTVSNRKGRLIYIYEYELTFKWQVNGMHEGTIVVLNIAHDTEPDEFQFDVQFSNEKDSLPYDGNVDLFVKSKGVDVIKRVLGKYPDALKAYAKDVVLPTNIKTATPQQSQLSDNSSKEVLTAEEDEFKCPVDILFNMFTDSNLVNRWTRGNCQKYDAVEQGEFMLYDRNITGRFTKLDRDKGLIKMLWRFKSWPAGFQSKTHNIFTRSKFSHTFKTLQVKKLKDFFKSNHERQTYRNTTDDIIYDSSINSSKVLSMLDSILDSDQRKDCDQGRDYSIDELVPNNSDNIDEACTDDIKFYNQLMNSNEYTKEDQNQSSIYIDVKQLDNLCKFKQNQQTIPAICKQRRPRIKSSFDDGKHHKCTIHHHFNRYGCLTTSLQSMQCFYLNTTHLVSPCVHKHYLLLDHVQSKKNSIQNSEQRVPEHFKCQRTQNAKMCRCPNNKTTDIFHPCVDKRITKCSNNKHVSLPNCHNQRVKCCQHQHVKKSNCCYQWQLTSSGMSGAKLLIPIALTTVVSVVSFIVVVITVTTLSVTKSNSNTSPGPSVQVFSGNAVYNPSKDSEMLKFLQTCCNSTEYNHIPSKRDITKAIRKSFAGNWLVIFNDGFNAINSNSTISDPVLHPRRLKVNSVQEKDGTFAVIFKVAYDSFCDFKTCGQSRQFYLATELNTVYGVDEKNMPIKLTLIQDSLKLHEDSVISMSISDYVKEFYDDEQEQSQNTFPVYNYKEIKISEGTCANESKENLVNWLNAGLIKDFMENNTDLPIFIELISVNATSNTIDINAVCDRKNISVNLSMIKESIDGCNTLNCELDVTNVTTNPAGYITIDKFVEILKKRETINRTCSST
ncbi:hypothetical protein GJ496_001169 [Pomphorhynchus laevis]|nr:hypothetical protein GJ496_001169 [Pomphorhynchus laevis]